MNSSIPKAIDLEVQAGTAEDLPSIEPLWIALYENQYQSNMLLRIPPNGFALWRKSVEVALGRFSCLFVIEEAGRIVGFLAGRIRSLPPHFGGGFVGFVSEVYVSDSHRGQGLGRKLLAAATEWFLAHKIERVELQVLVENTGARELYRSMGWVDELVQMVWHPPGKTEC